MISTKVITKILRKFQQMVPECEFFVRPEALAGFITEKLLEETSKSPGLGPIELMNAVASIDQAMEDKDIDIEVTLVQGKDGQRVVSYFEDGAEMEYVLGTHESAPLASAIITLGQRLSRK